MLFDISLKNVFDRDNHNTNEVTTLACNYYSLPMLKQPGFSGIEEITNSENLLLIIKSINQ